MRRRDKAGGKAVKTQRRKTLKRRNAPKTARRRSSRCREGNRCRPLTRERDEALEQQAATADVLKVISKLDPFNLQTGASTAMLDNAVRICARPKFGICVVEGDNLSTLRSLLPLARRMAVIRRHVTSAKSTDGRFGRVCLT